MPANTTPIFILSGFGSSPFGGITLAAASLASDGTSSSTIVTAGTNGTRIDAVRFTNSQASQAASSNNLVRVYVTDTSGLNPILVRETTMAAATRAAATPTAGASAIITFDQPLILKSGQLLKAQIAIYGGVQDRTDVVAFGGDF